LLEIFGSFVQDGCDGLEAVLMLSEVAYRDQGCLDVTHYLCELHRVLR
jgi:hypothetical protein